MDATLTLAPTGLGPPRLHRFWTDPKELTQLIREKIASIDPSMAESDDEDEQESEASIIAVVADQIEEPLTATAGTERIDGPLHATEAELPSPEEAAPETNRSERKMILAAVLILASALFIFWQPVSQ